VVGNWDDGTCAEGRADAIAVHKNRSTASPCRAAPPARCGADRRQAPFVPVGGETENGFRKLCAERSKPTA
jgi:ribose transport system substrate-binding protein